MSKTNDQSSEVMALDTNMSNASGVIESASRRRLIRFGASAVPVLATLTSQSALAGSCISTSAWGSDQISHSASQKARHDGYASVVNTGYTIAAWNTNDINNAAWTALKNSPNFNANGLILATLTFNQLYRRIVDKSLMRSPTLNGLVGTSNVIGSLGANDSGFFLVAQLNWAVGAKPPTQCVSDVNWKAIVAGTYPAGQPWDLAKIRAYLENNWIVQP